jgi:hypothetical protein
MGIGAFTQMSFEVDDIVADQPSADRSGDHG